MRLEQLVVWEKLEQLDGLGQIDWGQLNQLGDVGGEVLEQHHG